MKRLATIVVMALVLSLGLTACGSSSTTSNQDTTTATSSAPMTCPTDNTKAFPKAKFVFNIGVIAGSFHRWIYKPYKAGKFQKGADGKVLAVVKAAATAALIAHEVKEAKQNVQADPTLCKVLAEPMTKLGDAVGSLASNIKSGNFGAIAGFEGILATLKGTMANHGMKVTEQNG